MSQELPRKQLYARLIMIVGAFFIILSICVHSCGKDDNSPLEPEGSFFSMTGENAYASAYISMHAREPDSYQHQHTEHYRNADGSYVVRVTYKSKNQYGGYSLCTIVLRMDKNAENVTEVIGQENCI